MFLKNVVLVSVPSNIFILSESYMYINCFMSSFFYFFLKHMFLNYCFGLYHENIDTCQSYIYELSHWILFFSTFFWNYSGGGNVHVTVEKGDTFGEEGLLNRIKNHKGDVSSHEIIPNGEALITVIAHPIEGMVCFVIDFLIFIKYIWPQHETLCWAPSHCINILGKEIDTRSHGNIEMVRRFVARIPFFQQLSRSNQTELCRVMRQEKHEGNAHKIIFQEGWLGGSFYVIISGQVSVHQRLKVDEVVAATGGGKEAGGEVAGDTAGDTAGDIAGDTAGDTAKDVTEDTSEDDTAGGGGESKKQSPFDRSAPAYQTVVALRFQSSLDEKYGPAVAELRHGDSFGEKALHVTGVRNATIICQSDIVLLMVIDRESYNRIIKPKKNNIVMNVASAMGNVVLDDIYIDFFYYI